MSQTYYKLWIHLIWSTKDREPLIGKELRQSIFEHIKDKAKREKIHLDSINGTADHVHCLVSLSPRISISELSNKLKGESSHWINAGKLTKGHFAWQNGYSVFSVSESQVDKVRSYIQSQEEHHRKISYTEEVEEFLKLFKVEYSNERT